MKINWNSIYNMEQRGKTGQRQTNMRMYNANSQYKTKFLPSKVNQRNVTKFSPQP